MSLEIKSIVSDKVAQIALKDQHTALDNPSQSTKDAKSFMDHLVGSLKEVNSLQNNADALAQDVATGKSENLHETMLAISQAELSFNLMVQVRNKALEAYQDIMRMPV